jgi:hypothetical protein
MKEHRSERPAIWDYSNPRAEKRVSLRKRLAEKPPSANPPAEASAKTGSPAAKPPQKVRKKK